MILSLNFSGKGALEVGGHLNNAAVYYFLSELALPYAKAVLNLQFGQEEGFQYKQWI